MAETVFTWRGGSGAWNDPSRWTVQMWDGPAAYQYSFPVSAVAATRAPGAGDTVVIAYGPGEQPFVITGGGEAARFITAGDWVGIALVGTGAERYRIGSLEIHDRTLSVSGATLEAQRTSLDATSQLLLGDATVATDLWGRSYAASLGDLTLGATPPGSPGQAPWTARVVHGDKPVEVAGLFASEWGVGGRWDPQNGLIGGGAVVRVVFGDARNDVLAGGAGDDRIVADGQGARPPISGGTQPLFARFDNRVDAGAGKDTVLGGYGSDTLDGGAGDDVLIGWGAETPIRQSGGIGRDFHQFQDRADTLLGGAGNDTLLGGGGPDSLVGGAGDDSLSAGAGGGTMTGGGGHDTFSFGWLDLLWGEGGPYDLGAWITDFQHGTDKIDLRGYQSGPGHHPVEFRGETAAVLPYAPALQVGWTHTATNTTIHIGLPPKDGLPLPWSPVDTGQRVQNVSGWAADYGRTITLQGRVHLTPDDFLVAGSRGPDNRGVDARIVGSFGSDLLLGSEGHDLVYGDGFDGPRHGPDGLGGFVPGSVRLPSNIVAAGAGDDTVYGGYGAGSVLGEDGNDVLYGFGFLTDNLGRYGPTEAASTAGAHYISGGIGDDTLVGGGGADTLDGGWGDDLLRSGLGADRLTGGAGRDTFQFGWHPGLFRQSDTAVGDGLDLITDFRRGEDAIDLREFAAPQYGATRFAGEGGFAMVWNTQVRFFHDSGDTVVQVVSAGWNDRPAAGTPPLTGEIRIAGAHALTAGDFLL